MRAGALLRPRAAYPRKSRLKDDERGWGRAGRRRFTSRAKKEAGEKPGHCVASGVFEGLFVKRREDKPPRNKGTRAAIVNSRDLYTRKGRGVRARSSRDRYAGELCFYYYTFLFSSLRGILLSGLGPLRFRERPWLDITALSTRSGRTEGRIAEYFDRSLEELVCLRV